MKLHRFVLVIYIMVLAILLSACAGASTETDGDSQPALGPVEIIHLEGEKSYRSTPFTLGGPKAIKVYWQQESTGFELEIVNADEAVAEAPGGSITFELAGGSSQYIEDSPFIAPYEYVPGDYILQIDTDGSWEVWIKYVE
jgi:hypothetical protein